MKFKNYFYLNNKSALQFMSYQTNYLSPNQKQHSFNKNFEDSTMMQNELIVKDLTALFEETFSENDTKNDSKTDIPETTGRDVDLRKRKM